MVLRINERNSTERDSERSSSKGESERPGSGQSLITN
jgi:hypothetical protein